MADTAVNLGLDWNNVRYPSTACWQNAAVSGTQEEFAYYCGGIKLYSLGAKEYQLTATIALGSADVLKRKELDLGIAGPIAIYPGGFVAGNALRQSVIGRITSFNESDPVNNVVTMDITWRLDAMEIGTMIDPHPVYDGTQTY